MKEFLIILGLALGAIVVWRLYPSIKDKLYEGKSVAGKFESIFKRDMSADSARCTFYIFNDYNNGYSQSEWLDYYKKQTNNLDKKSQAYMDAIAPLANAIVVGEDGYFWRRGMENLRARYTQFQPGVNDRISLNFFVEPYEYKQNTKAAASYSRSTPKSSSQEDERYARMIARMKAEEELRKAKKQHTDAVYACQKWKGKDLESMYVAREKSAYAELLSAQAKYDSLK